MISPSAATMRRPDRERGVRGRALPGQLDRGAKETRVRPARAEQVAHRHHAAEPLHAGQRHGVPAVRRVSARQRERRRGRLPHEERRHGQVQLIGQGCRQELPDQDRASLDEDARQSRCVRSARMNGRDSGSPASMTSARSPSLAAAAGTAGLAQ